jgi:hypothetical protein
MYLVRCEGSAQENYLIIIKEGLLTIQIDNYLKTAL